MGKKSKRNRNKDSKGTTSPSFTVKTTMSYPIQADDTIVSNPTESLPYYWFDMTTISLTIPFPVEFRDLTQEIMCRPLNQIKFAMVQHLSCKERAFVLCKTTENQTSFAQLQRWILETVYNEKLSSNVQCAGFLLQHGSGFYLASSDVEMTDLMQSVNQFISVSANYDGELCYVQCDDVTLLGHDNLPRLIDQTHVICNN